jgi:tripartite-type tricarboxylate transporter receptor subunit TctC
MILPQNREKITMKGLRVSFALTCIALLAVPAHAQTYPSKPVTIIVTLAAGGAADVIARAVAQRLTEEWGQPVLVENRGGANNQVGTTAVAKAAPDGYTLLLTPEHTFTVNPFLYRKLSYDPVKDFTPISGLASISQSLVVHPSLPVKTVTELVALAKSKPGQLNYGGLGVASGPHLSMEMLQSMTGAKLTPVHYKGAAPALTDVVAGHIPMMFVSTGMVVQPAQAGQLRLLGVGSKDRLARLPELPTVGETLPGFTAVVWFGLFAPTGTPREVVIKINAAVQRILADPGFRERIIVPNFYEPIAGSPEQFAEHIRADSERWRKVIQEAKIAIEE